MRGTRLVLAGFSGGPDSAVLLHALAEALRGAEVPLPRVLALHVDHRARPDSADDTAACARFAAALSLPFLALRADPARVLRDGLASEGRLRDERYRLFRQAARDTGATAVFLAHHRDDQVESVVLAALRGAGLRGLRGMPARRPLDDAAAGPRSPGSRPTGAAPPVHVVRPLLALPRRVLLDHLERHRLPHRVDPTNHELRFRRNRVRLVLLPALRDGPAAGRSPGRDPGSDPEPGPDRDPDRGADPRAGTDLDEGLLRLAGWSRVLWRRAEQRARRGALADSDAMHAAITLALGAAPGRRASRLLQAALTEGVDHAQTARGGAVLRARGGQVSCVAAEDPTPDAASVASAPDAASIHAGHAARLLAAIGRLTPEERRRRIDGRGRLYLDADATSSPLCCRTRAPGDRIHLPGLAAPKRLKTLLIARGVPRAERDAVPVLADERGVVGVVGLGPDRRAAVHAATRRILRIVVRPRIQAG